MSPTTIHAGRRGRTVAATCLAAAAATGIAASPAAADSYEQISRGTGAQGWAPFSYSIQPKAASDTGRYAVASSGPINGTLPPTLVRDIKSNTTTQLAAPNETVLGFDAAERLALVVRRTEDQLTYLVRPVTGGADQVVTTKTTSINYVEPTATISGNGKVVAIAGDGVSLYTLATGAVKTYAIEAPRLNARSLSDDGSVIAGGRSYSNGFTVIKGVAADLDYPAVVSPNGAVVVTLDDVAGAGYNADQIVAQRVSDGATKTIDMPAGEAGNLAWVSPDGSRAAIAPGVASTKAYQVNFATAKWSTFGGAFTADLQADFFGFNTDPTAVISRNGRYAVVEYGGVFSGQAALVDLNGGDLPGDQEPLSASSYVMVTPPIATGDCATTESKMVSNFFRPKTWAPKPRRAELIVTIDGKETLRKVFTRAFDTRDPNAFPIDTQEIPFAGNAKSITIRANVIDEQGRLVSTTETTKPFCLGPIGPL